MSFLSLVLKNLLRRKVRSGLTLAGVTVAIGTVVGLTGLAGGFERSFVGMMEGHHIELVAVRAGVVDRFTSNVAEGSADAIRKLPGVKAVAPNLIQMTSLDNQRLVGVPIQGWPADSFLFENIKVVEGERPPVGETGWAMVGTVLAKQLGRPIGAPLEIEGETFRIAAVYESFNVYEDSGVVVPLRDLQRVLLRSGLVTGFYVRTDDPADPTTKDALVADVCRRIEALTDEDGDSLRLAVLPTRDYAGSMVQLHLVKGMAWATSVIALTIGVIFLLATMLTAVFERTREVGVLRALGWRQWRVTAMILLESVVLSGMGAVTGTVMGVGVLALLSRLPLTEGLVSGEVHWTMVVLGIGLALLVGLAGGAYPAMVAARLLPADALRHE